jgi:hypothetical protein
MKSVPPCELYALPLYHVVQTNVVLQRVGARNVVVVSVLQPEHEPGTLIDAPGDRLETSLRGEGP